MLQPNGTYPKIVDLSPPWGDIEKKRKRYGFACVARGFLWGLTLSSVVHIAFHSLAVLP